LEPKVLDALTKVETIELKQSFKLAYYRERFSQYILIILQKQWEEIIVKKTTMKNDERVLMTQRDLAESLNQQDRLQNCENRLNAVRAEKDKQLPHLINLEGWAISRMRGILTNQSWREDRGGMYALLTLLKNVLVREPMYKTTLYSREPDLLWTYLKEMLDMYYSQCEWVSNAIFEVGYLLGVEKSLALLEVLFMLTDASFSEGPKIKFIAI
jgi:hypothetical protein